MNYIGTNAGAIAAATVVGLLFGLLRARLAGRALRPGLVALAVLAEAWLAAILAGALILAPADGAGPWTMALMSAAVIWAGFVGPTIAVTNAFHGVPARITAFDVVHWLAAMLAQAATLQAIGLVRPA